MDRWLGALASQTAWPEEFVIVDGGSTDGSVERITNHPWPTGVPTPRVIVQKCNIAEGRNLAIRSCSAGIIASTDAGSVPDPDWFAQIVRILLEDPTIDVVGGRCITEISTPFQRRYARYLAVEHGICLSSYSPSSRNTAFRRRAWEWVGGYPEWLTLTAEDSLFNLNLHAVGCRYHHEPFAIVRWEGRSTMKSYLRMLYSYGYGSAESHEARNQYLRCIASTVFPPLILLSRHPLRDVGFRYIRNALRAFGWVHGKLKGKRFPPDWRNTPIGLLSPNTMLSMNKHQ